MDKAKITYQANPRHYVAVDSIVFGFDGEDLKILLIKRKIEPLKGEWSLMGGFVQEKQSIDQAAEIVLKNLTGLDNVYLEQLSAFGEEQRDPIDRVISVAYYALIKLNEYDRQIVHNNGGEWFSISNYPKLILDHEEMVQTAIGKLRRKCRTQPIGFELLPEKFTIPQLQSLYEAIWMQKLDKRNFRKKFLSMNLLDKLEEKDKENSKKALFIINLIKKNTNN